MFGGWFYVIICIASITPKNRSDNMKIIWRITWKANFWNHHNNKSKKFLFVLCTCSKLLGTFPCEKRVLVRKIAMQWGFYCCHGWNFVNLINFLISAVHNIQYQFESQRDHVTSRNGKHSFHNSITVILPGVHLCILFSNNLDLQKS